MCIYKRKEKNIQDQEIQVLSLRRLKEVNGRKKCQHKKKKAKNRGQKLYNKSYRKVLGMFVFQAVATTTTTSLKCEFKIYLYVDTHTNIYECMNVCIAIEV